MGLKKRMSARQMLITEIKNDLTTISYLDTTYYVFKDNQRVAIRRVRVCGMILDVRRGVSKNKKRYVSMTITDGTEIIRTVLFGNISQVADLVQGDYVDIVGKLQCYSFTSDRDGSELDVTEWTISIETIVKKDLEFFQYFILSAFESKSGMSLRLEQLYVDTVRSLKFIRGIGSTEEDERSAIELLKSPVLDFVSSNSDVGVTTSSIAKYFGASEELIAKVITMLKLNGAVVTPEVGLVYPTQYFIPLSSTHIAA